LAASIARGARLGVVLVAGCGGIPDGGKIAQLAGAPCAFTPDYALEEMVEIANKLYQKSLTRTPFSPAR
jgi:hypothetical protein